MLEKKVCQHAAIPIGDLRKWRETRLAMIGGKKIPQQEKVEKNGKEVIDRGLD